MAATAEQRPGPAAVGVVGLGTMGAALAAALVTAGHHVLGYDAAGPERAPDGVQPVDSLEELAGRVPVLLFSLPDGPASEAAATAVAGAQERRVELVVDTSTIGPTAAGAVAELLGAAGIGYLDAPVSGGVAGARSGTLTVMYAGTDDSCRAGEPLIAALSTRRRRVGTRPGMGQALKLASTFLTASALVSTSEALAFGLSVGLDMATMLEMLNASSAQSAAPSDQLPRPGATEQPAVGFANTLLVRDLALYHQEAARRGTPEVSASTTLAVWRRFAEAEPGADFTAIFPFVAGT